MIKLEFPNETHREMYEGMLKEWSEFEEIPTSPGRLFIWSTYEEFLGIIQKDVTENDNGVNSTLFFLVGNDTILWAIQIRHSIDHPNLRETGGHIWYGIRPSARGNWYATKMLELALIEAEKLWIEKILISCHSDNPASEKVILKNGWVFRKEVPHEGKILHTYWITL